MKPGKLPKKPIQKLNTGGGVNTPVYGYKKPTGGTYVNGVYTPNQNSQGLNQMPLIGNGNNTSGLAGLGSAAADVGSGLLATGAANTMMRNVADEKGQIDVNKSKKAGTMTGAAAGLKAGATIGLNPAALAATGGLSALAAPVGAGIGALVGRYNAKKNAEEDNKTNLAAYEKSEAERIAAEAKAKKDAFYNTNINRNMNAALTERAAGYKDGGKIEGKGTAKSDEIKAKIKEGSFIVPAENAPIAKELKSKVLKAPNVNKKANLNQKGGETVMLSNGEYSFTPEEAQELLAKGIDIKKLAPNAKQHLTDHMNKGGTVKGYKYGDFVEDDGIDPELERKKLEEEKRKEKQNLTAAEKKQKESEDKRLKYGANYQNSLRQQEEERQTKKNIEKLEKELAALEKSYNDFDSQSKSAINAPSKKGGIGDYSRPSTESVRKQKEVMLKEIQKKKSEVSDNKTKLNTQTNSTASKSNNGQNTSYFGDAKQKEQPKSTTNKVEDYQKNMPKEAMAGYKPPVKAPPVKKTPSKATEKKVEVVTPPSDNGLTVEQMRGIKPAGFEGDVPEKELESVLPNQTEVEKASGQVISPTGNSTFDYEKNMTPETPNGLNDLTTSLSSGLRSTFDYALPAAQTYMGLKSLQQAGKRPVDKIDPDYLRAIEETRGILGEANNRASTADAAAKYGYSAEELAMLNMQNQEATAAGRFAARNYSGGSAGNAFNMERTALNDSVGRGLQAKIQDKNLRLQKQQYADSRKAYADSKQSELNSLLNNKANRSRDLFNDTLTGWKENQSAGSELVGAGIQNLIGAKRYKDEQAASAERLAKYGV